MTLHAERSGAGPLIVFVHGFGETLFTWRDLVGLSSDYRVVRLDLPGFGRSPKPRSGDYTIDGLATALEQFLRAEGDVFALVGHSLGGLVALRTAMRMGQAGPRRLVLLDPPAFPQRQPLFMRVLRTPVIGALSVRLVPVTWQVRLVMREAHYDRSTIDPAAVREYAASLGSPGGRHALHQVALGIVPPDIDAFIRGYQTIAAPALVIWGRHDRIVPIATGQALAGALPSARLAILENVGHLPQEERPSDTLALMREFLTAP